MTSNTPHSNYGYATMTDLSAFDLNGIMPVLQGMVYILATASFIYLKTRKPKPKNDVPTPECTDPTTSQYPDTKRLMFSCFAFAGVAMSLFLHIFSILDPIIIGIAFLFCIFAFLHTGPKIKCIICQKCLLIQSGERSDLKYTFPLIRTVLDILRKNPFSCMYCGKKYKVTP